MFRGDRTNSNDAVAASVIVDLQHMDPTPDDDENITDRRAPHPSPNSIQHAASPATDQPVRPRRFHRFHDQSHNNPFWGDSKQSSALPHEPLGWLQDQSHNNASLPHSKQASLALPHDLRSRNAEYSTAYQHGAWGSIYPDDTANNMLRNLKLEPSSSSLIYHRNPDGRVAPNTSDMVSHNYVSSSKSRAYIFSLEHIMAVEDEPTESATRKEETIETTKVNKLQATQSDPDSDNDDDLDGHALKAEMSGCDEDFHPGPYIRDTDNEHRRFMSQFSPFE